MRNERMGGGFIVAIVLFFLFLFMFGAGGPIPEGRAAELPLLTVDGVEYAPSKVSGPVFHYETPDTDPVSAFTARNVWVGNGSENLPCRGGIHWIDNENILTVSHCLGGDTPSTTTTEPQGSTTTVVTEVTTTVTSVPSSTTTTVGSSTTTLPPTTTVPPDTTTSTPPSSDTTPPSELPRTGPNDKWEALAILGAGMMIVGVLLAGGRKG